MNELIDVDVKGLFWVMQWALPLLNEGARVINTLGQRVGVSVLGERSFCQGADSQRERGVAI
ncbi:MAG: hypothetical protein JNK48_33110 [Bryobacterales bacterium]|nr:hypothetical protein [Bryobacterales bacterium]